MKPFKKLCALAACLPFVVPTLGCAAKPSGDISKGESTLLAAAKTPEPLTYVYEYTDAFYTLRNATVGFTGDFTGAAYEVFGNNQKNLTVSPISVYLALGVTAAIAEGNTKAELLTALGVTADELESGFDPLCRAVRAEWNCYNGKNKGRIELSNSVWVADGVNVKTNKLSELADMYYCSSYSADFKNNNVEANAAVRSFIKDKTHGLIDKSFALSPDTLFTVINALYLKDVWNEYGDDIEISQNKYDFKKGDGGTKKTKLLCSQYLPGRAKDCGAYTSFFTNTDNGVNISFMLPKPGAVASDVFTAENFKQLADMEYVCVDDDKKELYFTSCRFPQFKADFDEDIKDMLSSRMGISSLFTDSCDLSGLTDKKVRCSKINHVTDLTVDRKGIEGAAVTVEALADNSVPDYNDYKRVYEIFEVDSAFGFCISYNGVTLFSGVVNDIKAL